MPETHNERRKFLTAAGIGLALPMLESVNADGASSSLPVPPARRFVAIGTYLGFHTPSWFPRKPGAEYETSEVLKPIERHRKQFSLFSGLDHRAPNGHSNWRNFLTGSGTRSVSLDQVIAEYVGDQTRYSSLQLTCGSANGTGQISFTQEGVPLPMVGRPSVAFSQLFSSDSDKARMRYVFESGRSVLDLVLDEARSLDHRVSQTDRQKLSEYFSSVRDVEKKIQKRTDWLDRPSPQVDYQLPKFDPAAPDLSLECESIMYDLMALALETDSTRVISLLVPGTGQVFTIDGEKLIAGYHGLSHHGHDPNKIADFNRIGIEHVSRFGRFLDQLREKKDSEDQPLLDSTIVLYGSGMGDANTHNNSNLPVLVAGGAFRHGQYHAIDRTKDPSSTPLYGDLFITFLQQMGIEREQFANASGNMNEFLQ